MCFKQVSRDAEQQAMPIAYMFNQSVRQYKLPTANKATEVGPQHNKDDMLQTENDRLVSILNSLSKTFDIKKG